MMIALGANCRYLMIGTREGSFDGMLNKRTFEVVFVNKTNAVGIEKEVKGKTVSYEGSEITIKL